MMGHPYTAYCKSCNQTTPQTVLKSEVIEKSVAKYSDGIERFVSNTRLDVQCPCGFKDWKISESYVYETLPDGSKVIVFQ